MAQDHRALADIVEARLPGPVASVVHKLCTEDLFLLAAALAFYALVSVVPFAVLALWVVSLFTGKAEVHQMADRLAQMLPANLGVQKAFTRVADLGGSLGLGALVAMLWPATAYGGGLRRAFARLSADQEEEGKGIRGRALALGLLGVVPALALVGLVASYLGTTLFGRGGGARLAGWLLSLAFGFIASTIAVAAIYRLFVPRPLSWAAIGRGAATAAAAISVVSFVYVVFLNTGVDFQNRYATSGLAAVVLLAGWLFLSNALILVGFQVAQET